MKQRPCPCGSGQPRYDNYDARGIFLTFTCHACHQRKMATYRKEVLVNPRYECDEPIEED
jgi:hypothetical protein